MALAHLVMNGMGFAPVGFVVTDGLGFSSTPPPGPGVVSRAVIGGAKTDWRGDPPRTASPAWPVKGEEAGYPIQRQPVYRVDRDEEPLPEPVPEAPPPVIKAKAPIAQPGALPGFDYDMAGVLRESVLADMERHVAALEVEFLRRKRQREDDDAIAMLLLSIF